MNEQQTNEINVNKEYRRGFTRIGLAFFCALLVSVLASFLYSYLLKTVLSDYAESELLSWAANFVIMYVLSFPVAILILRGGYSSSEPMPQRKLRAWEMVALVACIYALTYLGNYVGQMINSVISSLTGGISSTSQLTEMIDTSSPIPFFLMTVVFAPITEEILFRYFLVGKLRPYGEKTAVIMGGLFFGLFHGNLEQFFYAALVGMAFSYIYVKTGKLKYTIFLHMMMNLLGGFVPFLIMRYFVDYNGLMEALLKVTEVFDPTEQLELFADFFSKHSADYAIMIGYNMTMLGVAFVGAFILLSQRKRIRFAKGERHIDHSLIGETIFLSPGVLLFVVGSLLYMGLQLYLAVNAAN